jgi:hypothetical protein
MSFNIPLVVDNHVFSKDDLTVLYSYPNIEDGGATLEQTIAHWFGLTLARDNLFKEAEPNIEVENTSRGYVVRVKASFRDGLPHDAEFYIALYQSRLPRFLMIGLMAYRNILGSDPIKLPDWDPDGAMVQYYMDRNDWNQTRVDMVN